jgi:uncharacterized alpha/beta hydrolase family protein
MKNIIKVCITLIVISIVLIILLLVSQDKNADPLTITEIMYVKDLPEIHFNWTPINERTEKPKPIPTLHFNELER